MWAVILASLLTCGIALWSMPLTLGLDLRGGTEFLLQVQGNPTRQALDQAASVIRKRLDVFGGREISIQPEGSDRLKIQIPGFAGTPGGRCPGSHHPRRPNSSFTWFRSITMRFSAPR